MTSNHNPDNSKWYPNPPTADCPTNERRISDYLSHTIAPTDAAALQQHLTSCSYCSSLLQSYSNLDLHLKQLPNPPASPRLRRAVLTAVKEAEAEHRSLKPVKTGLANRAPRLAGSVVAVAALAVFASAFAMLLNGHGLIGDTPVALASPTAKVPDYVTPIINEPVKVGSPGAIPELTVTPLPSALMVAQATNDSNKLLFSSVDSQGMTKTIASPPGALIRETNVGLDASGNEVAYAVSEQGKSKLQVYDFTSGKTTASIDIPGPSSGYPNAYKLAPKVSFSPDGRQFAFSASNFDGETAYGAFDIVSGRPLVTVPNPSAKRPSAQTGCCLQNLVGWGNDGFIYMGRLGEGLVGAELFTFKADGHQAKNPATNYTWIDNGWMNNSGTFIYAAGLASGIGNKGGNQILFRYDVNTDSYTSLVNLGATEQLFATSRDEIGKQGLFAEYADGSTLLYVVIAASGNLELRRVNLLNPNYKDKLADVYLPAASSNPQVTALQVCGTTAYYQVAVTDTVGDRQTTLIAQPLSGQQATPLAASGQLVGCTNK